MGEFAAKQGDTIEGEDMHEEILPVPPGGTTFTKHQFRGELMTNLSPNVNIEGMPAATQGSKAENIPPHQFAPSNTGFKDAPDNMGEVTVGSPTVFINGSPAARNNDQATTCNFDNRENSSMVVVKSSTVSMG